MNVSQKTMLAFSASLALLALAPSAPAEVGPPATAHEGLLAGRVGDDDLRSARGGERVQSQQLTQSTETALQQGNTATGNITGDNLISGGAFAGTTGFPTIIQNTGNNVLIQDSLIVNVGYKP